MKQEILDDIGKKRNEEQKNSKSSFSYFLLAISLWGLYVVLYFIVSKLLESGHSAFLNTVSYTCFFFGFICFVMSLYYGVAALIQKEVRSNKLYLSLIGSAIFLVLPFAFILFFFIAFNW